MRNNFRATNLIFLFSSPCLHPSDRDRPAPAAEFMIDHVLQHLVDVVLKVSVYDGPAKTAVLDIILLVHREKTSFFIMFLPFCHSSR